MFVLVAQQQPGDFIHTLGMLMSTSITGPLSEQVRTLTYLSMVCINFYTLSPNTHTYTAQAKALAIPIPEDCVTGD